MTWKDTSNRRFYNWDNAFQRVQDFRIQKGANSFINPFSLLKLGDTENITNKVDHLYVDGISLVKLINIFLRKSTSRYSFDDTSVAPVAFNLLFFYLLYCIRPLLDIIEKAISVVRYFEAISVF